MDEPLRFARRTAIGDVAEGAVVKIVGKLRPVEPPLRSPIQQLECVWYDALVEQAAPVPGGGWVPFERLREGTELRIADETGEAIVLLGDEPLVWTDPAVLDVPASWQARVPAAPGAFRGVERVLREGMRVAVLGAASWRFAPSGVGAGAYRGGGRALYLEGNPAVLVSDDGELFW